MCKTAADTPAESKAGAGNVSGARGPDGVRLWEDEFHRLHASIDGKEFENLRPHLAFPLSGKADYVSLVDTSNKEAALLAHPHRLDRESRRVLEKFLEKMYYVAKIECVYSVREKMGIGHWKVMTDRGYAEFEVVDREHIRRLPGGRVLIADVDGTRFEIPDMAALDPRSQSLIRSET